MCFSTCRSRQGIWRPLSQQRVSGPGDELARSCPRPGASSQADWCVGWDACFAQLQCSAFEFVTAACALNLLCCSLYCSLYRSLYCTAGPPLGPPLARKTCNLLIDYMIVPQAPGRARSVPRWWHRLLAAGSAASSWHEGRLTATSCTTALTGAAEVTIVKECGT